MEPCYISLSNLCNQRQLTGACEWPLYGRHFGTLTDGWFDAWIGGVAGESGLASQRSHVAHCFSYGVKCHWHGARIAILEHHLNVAGDLGAT